MKKNLEKLVIVLSLGILLSCSPTYTNWRNLQNIQDKVFPKFDYITDQEKYGVRDYRATKEERWENRRLVGDCDEYAQELCDRLNKRGYDAKFVALWRNEGNVVDGFEYKGHAVCVVDGFVFDNNSKWVYPEKELWKKYKGKIEEEQL